ncbi:MAG: hypothetical protein KJ944_00070 [Alphaproteobacteria bacterium]|nr:hypothetical protein [Alphaproteobacteria bacterium]MBU1561548.1 hypothetical protein [Alphaproteobacteria bacterium]MBU2300969.1 hypothetical protein [Alphaproteobacteria bacterium]MBU2367251.1 hypothetical protein [Alphaproteobacteria bacterium]
MAMIPSDYYRTKAAAELAGRGLYPKQGVLHGLMYPMCFAAGMAMGTGLAGVPTWVTVTLSIAALAGGWFWGASIDNRYDAVVAERAVEMEQEAAEARPPRARA